MKKNKILINITARFLNLVILLISTKLFASVDQPYMWNSVEVNAEKNFSIKLVRNRESLKIESFSLKIDGKKVEVPRKWFEDINQPELRTLKASWGCGPLSFDSDGKLIIASCSSYISFNYFIELKSDSIPLWYENPIVTYYIENGHVTKRLIEKKDAEDHWTMYWLDAFGNNSKGEIKK